MMKIGLKKAMVAFLAAGLALTGSGCGKASGAVTAKAGVSQTVAGEHSGKEDFTGLLAKWWNKVANGAKKPAEALIGQTGTKKDETGQAEAGTANGQEENIGFRAAKNYRELLDAMGGNGMGLAQWGTNHYFAMDSANGAYDLMEDGVEMPDAEEGGATEPSGKDYSDTNAQVEGIAEADIVKTDGEYIYILSKNEGASRVFIVRAEDGTLAFESSFSLETSPYFWQEEMYVSGNRLVIVRQEEKETEPTARVREDEFYIDRWFGGYTERQTRILIYDITDRKAPVLAAEHVQDGNYVNSREKDGYLYVISEKGIYYNYIQYIDRVFEVEDTDVLDAVSHALVGGAVEWEDAGENLLEEERARLPQVDGDLIAPDCIYFCENNMDSVYTIVTAICLDTPEKLADSLSFAAKSAHCYVSGNAIYLAAYDWGNYGEKEWDETNIVKIAYENGKLGLAAQGKVKGSLDDQFSMDEKDGYLRIVTTVDHYKLVQEKDGPWQEYDGRSNSLYVLDADLKLVGSLEDLAKDEMIYSARFLGDTAYFVTFRNTDPLFSVDVSDPAHPVLLGALKIPGFSDYLHPYGENLLLGIGYETGRMDTINCVKLTMFDISDPLHVVEKHTMLLEDYYTSEACSNHKAVLVDEERSLIGLPLAGNFYSEGSYRNYTETKAYAVYGYDEEKGFYQRFEKEYTREWEGGYYGPMEFYVPEELPQENYDVETATAGEPLQTEAETEKTVYSWNDWYCMRLRGIYIGDYFYLVNQMQEVRSWQMGQEGFSEVAVLELR